MYLKLNKWISNGVSEYKTAYQYLNEKTSTIDELVWAAESIKFGTFVKRFGYIVGYSIVVDAASKNKISLNYYTSKEIYENNIKSSLEYKNLVAARNIMVERTGLMLVEKEVEVLDTELSMVDEYSIVDDFFKKL